MSDHLKRLAAPRSWPLKRKLNIWTAKQSPGSHSVEESVPALVMLRDIISVCDTAREAKRIVANRDVLVDGKAIKEVKVPIGLMDVVSIPVMNLYYRIVLTDKGKIAAVPITKDEAAWKLTMIEDKTRVAGGKMQINCHDGRNILIDGNRYKTGDVLRIAVPGQKIEEALELKAGAVVLIFKGQHAGKTAIVSDVIIKKDASANVVKFTDGSETVKENVFVIGEGSPAIKLPEVSA